MGLRGKVAIILAISTLAMLAGALAIHRSVVLPQLLEAEGAADRLNLRRIELSYDFVRRRLEDWAFDYTVWDDAYAFARGENPGFGPENFLLSTLQRQRAHGVIYVDAAGRILYQAEVDLLREAFLTQPRLSPAEIAQLLPSRLPASAEPPELRSGLARVAAGALLYSSISIKRSDSSGDAPGNMLAYRLIEDDLLAEVSQHVQLPVKAHLIDPAAGAPPVDSEYRDAEDRMRVVVDADDGSPLLQVEIELPPGTIDRRVFPASMWAVLGVALGVFLLMLLLLERAVLLPVRRVVRHLQSIRDSANYGLRLAPQGSDEIAVLGRECDELIACVESQHRRLNDLSSLDELTGVANRRVFDQRLADFTALAKRRDTSFALLLCDLDAFKAYNDALGHVAGDTVLRRFGALLREAVVRESDVACRYGGEEFAVLLPDTDAEGAARVAARLHEQLAAQAIAHPQSPTGAWLTVSIGIAVSRPNDATPEGVGALVTRADEALYAAKHAGRNRTVIAPA